MLSVFALLVGIGVVICSLRGNPKAPTPLTEEQLRALGYAEKEARREARAQRNESRAATRTILEGIKAGSQASRAVARLGKKI